MFMLNSTLNILICNNNSIGTRHSIWREEVMRFDHPCSSKSW